MRFITYFSILAFLASGSTDVSAQNNWDGDNPLGNFTWCSNWFGDTCPTAWNNTTDLLFQYRNNPAQVTLYFDLGGTRLVRDIRYQNTFTAGLPLNGDGNRIEFYGKIENLTANYLQTINIPLTARHATNIELNPISGGLTFNQPILNPNNAQYNVWGNNGRTLTLNNYPEGSNAVQLFLRQYSIVDVNFNNAASFKGGCVVESGELWINSNGVVQGPIQVGNGTPNFNKIYISHASTATTVANAITVPTNSPNTSIGSLNTSNAHTYSGTINLSNNDVYVDPYNAGGALNFTGVISGTGGIRKINAGLARLSAANTYTGRTAVNAGTLQLGAANVIADASNVTLNGGTFSTGSPVGFSETVGNLTLSANSTIALGTGSHTLNFAASNAIAWTAGTTLTITGWNTGCNKGRIFFGNSAAGLTAAQLAQITFQGYPAGSKLTAAGELIPNNISITATGGTLLSSYATVRLAFAAINSGTHTGAITLTLLDDTTETAIAVLNNNAAATSVLIQPGGCGARTVNGSIASNSMIDFNGADNVTVDGLNTDGNSLTITNTFVGTNGTSTIGFRNDATFNTITNCTVLGSSTAATGANGGNIWFGSGSSLTGNDNNVVSNCNIGPAGTNLPSKGVYFTGTQTVGLENNNITITSNNIYDCFTTTSGNSAGIDVNTGSYGVTITNNRIYQTGVRTPVVNGQAFAGVRISNTSGDGYLVSGNTIGYASAAGTGTATFTSASTFTYAVFGIDMNTSVAGASSVQGNTIAGISYTGAPNATNNGFYGMIIRGGQVHIGDVTGNTIGLPSAPIDFTTTTTATTGIFGINVTSASTVPIRIYNNTIQSINYTAAGAAPLNCHGIVTSSTGSFTVRNNTIGNANVANSISIGTLGVTTGIIIASGISTSATGTVIIGEAGYPNTIQNLSVHSAANNDIYGIRSTGTTAGASSFSYNAIKGYRITSATGTNTRFYGIATNASNGGLTIRNNLLGTAADGLVTYTATGGNFVGITTSTVTSTGDVTITENDITGVNHLVTNIQQHHYINNNISSPATYITNNLFTNLVSNTTGPTTMIVNTNNIPTGGLKYVNNNRIVGTFAKTGGSGTFSVYFDGGTSASGATVRNWDNDFSNITLSGTATNNGWQNHEGGFTSKSIMGNVFNNWTSGTGTMIGINVNLAGGTSVMSNNTITNWNSSGAMTAMTTNTLGTGNSMTIANNTITNLTGATTITGINSDLPATMLSQTIQNNNISGLSNTTNNNMNAIRDYGASPSKSISNNTVSNLTAAGTTWALNINNGGTVAVAGNTISSISTSADNRILGIFAGLIATGSVSVTGNSINGITSTSTGTSARVYGIDAAGTVPITISNNTITNCNGAGVNLAAAVVGLYISSTSTSVLAEHNTVSDVGSTNNSGSTIGVAGILTFSSSAGGAISKNRVYGISNASTDITSSTIGCSINGGNWIVANNMISIVNNSAASASGISELTATGTRKYFYNSIYLGGTSPSASLSNGIGSFGGAEFKNNILYNTRTSSGKNYALALNGMTGLSSNHNIFYTNDASTVVLMSSDRSFLQWQSYSGGDGNSFSGNTIAFASANTADLHITGACTDAESGGIPVLIIDDFDNQARNGTTPDIGADEFTGILPAAVTCPNTSICLGGTATLNAASSDGTYVYTWSPATGLSATTGAIINASPTVTTTYMITATSPAGCVKTQFVTVTVYALPTAITVNPPVVTACLNTTQIFVASPVSNSTVSVGNPNATSLAANTPYRQGVSTSESRVQYLVTRAELNALGLNTAAKIMSLGFEVTSAGAGAMPSYTISIAHTAATSLTATYIATGFTTVFTAANLTPTAGVNTHTFATPFDWNGTSNLVINICSNGSGGTASTVRASNMATPMTTSGIATGQCGIATGATNMVRPVMLFGFQNPITWSPNTELFTDALATVAYVSGTHATTVYAHASAPRLYTATATSPVGNCTITATGMFDTAVSTWNGTAWSPATPMGNTSLVFAGNFSSTANLSGCSCTVSSGDVVINGPHSLTLNEGLTVNAGPGISMTFTDTASLMQINDAAGNSGNIRMERITQPMYRYDYTYWGSPVTQASNFTLGNLSPLTRIDKYYSWTPTVSNSFGTWFQESAATVMIPAKGYIVRAPDNYSMSPMVKIPYTGMFTGTPNNGVITIPILHGTVPSPNYNDDYNLLSNPYPSAVDAEEFLSDPLNVPVLDGTIYFWTHNSPITAANPDPFYGDFIYNYSANDYASWNKLGGTGTTSAAGSGGQVPNGFIATGQGFFTRSAGATSGTVATFNNSMRVAGNNTQFFRTANQQTSDFERHRIWLNLTGNTGSFNQILIGYADGATLGWDRSYDGEYFSEGSTVEFYSTIADHKLVIQGRPIPFTDQDRVPLGYLSSANGTFSFRIDHFDPLFENQNIYIQDLLLGVIHDLKQSPYVFTTEAGRFDTRFVLRFNQSTLQTVDFETDAHLTAFIQNKQLRIESTKDIETVAVFDVTGKRLMLFSPYKNRKSITRDFTSANGVYLLRIEYSDGTIATAKVLH